MHREHLQVPRLPTASHFPSQVQAVLRRRWKGTFQWGPGPPTGWDVLSCLILLERCREQVESESAWAPPQHHLLRASPGGTDGSGQW